jgi:hypothetical protein
MQETNISIKRFILSLYSPIMGQKSPQHAAGTGFYDVIVNLMQLYAFVDLNCSHFVAVFHLSTIGLGTVYPNKVS